MPDSSKSFFNVLVVVLLGALFATSATINDSWKQMNENQVESSPITQQENSAL